MKKTREYYRKKRAARIFAYSLAASMSMGSVLPAMAAAPEEGIYQEYEESLELTGEGAEYLEDMLSDAGEEITGEAAAESETAEEKETAAAQADGETEEEAGEAIEDEGAAAGEEVTGFAENPRENTRSTGGETTGVSFVASTTAEEGVVTTTRGLYIVKEGQDLTLTLPAGACSLTASDGAAEQGLTLTNGTAAIAAVTADPDDGVEGQAAPSATAVLTAAKPGLITITATAPKTVVGENKETTQETETVAQASILVLGATLTNSRYEIVDDRLDTLMTNNDAKKNKADIFASLVGYEEEYGEEYGLQVKAEAVLDTTVSGFDRAYRVYPDNTAFTIKANEDTDGVYCGEVTAVEKKGNHCALAAVQFTVNEVDADGAVVKQLTSVTTSAKQYLINVAELKGVSITNANGEKALYAADGRAANIKVAAVPEDAFSYDVSERPRISLSMDAKQGRISAASLSENGNFFTAKVTPADGVKNVEVSAAISGYELSSEGKKASVKFNVESRSISVDKTNVSLDVAEEETLTVSMVPTENDYMLEAFSEDNHVRVTTGNVSGTATGTVSDETTETEADPNKITVLGLSNGADKITIVAREKGADGKAGAEIARTEVKVQVNRRTDVTTLSVSPSVLIMSEKDTRKLEWSAGPNGYTPTPIHWEVVAPDDSAINAAEYVNVDKEGNVTALKATPEKGIDIIGYMINYKMDSSNNLVQGPRVKSNKVNVIVKAAQKALQIGVSAKDVILNAPFLAADTGQTVADSAKIAYTVYPENAGHKQLTWSAEYKQKDSEGNESTVTVSSVKDAESGLETLVTPYLTLSDDENGTITITSAAAGAVVLTGTSEDGPTVTIKVNVNSQIIEGDEDYAQSGYWVAPVEDKTYTGSPVKPEPNVYFGGNLLMAGRDYTISYKNNLNAADINASQKPTLMIKGKGAYAKMPAKEIYFNINKASISDITLADGTKSMPEDFILTNMEVTKKNNTVICKPVVLYQGKTVPAKEYDLSVSPITDANGRETGSTVTIDFHSDSRNFMGGTSYQWVYSETELLKASSVKINVNDGKALTYTGVTQTPDFSITFKDADGKPKTLSTAEKTVDGKQVSDRAEIEKNFDAVWTNNTKAGTAKLTLYAKNGGSFTGTKTQSFKIEKMDLKAAIENKKAGISIDQSTLGYTKSGAKPAVIVTLQNGNGPEPIRLEEGKDYKVSYLYKTVEKVAKARVAARVTGIGSYKGTITTEYEDTANASIDDMTVSIGEFYYTNKADAYKKVKIQVFDEDRKELKEGLDYQVDFDQNTEAIPVAGSTVRFSIKGLGKYADKTAANSEDTQGTGASEDVQTTGTTQTDAGTQTAESAASQPVTLERSFMVKAGKINGGSFVIKADAVSRGIDGKLKFDKDSFKTAEVKIGGKTETLTCGTDFGAAAYTFNEKNNTGKVILVGLNRFGGTKTVSFKLSAAASTASGN